MKIDPRNPLVRYLDKVILALAALVAILALLRAFSGGSPATRTIAETTQALEELERLAGAKPVPRYEEPEDYQNLADRFHRESMPQGVALRKYVFSSPGEIIGKEKVIEFRPDKEVSERPAEIYWMAGDYPRLRDVDYDKAEVEVIGDKGIALIELDRKRKALGIRPVKAGLARVRVEFPAGSSFEFQLTIKEIPVAPVAEPEPPVDVVAKAAKGRVTLTWKTNEKSCPATSYLIYRSEGQEGEGQKVGELAVGGRENPVDPDPLAESPPPKVCTYWWDDFSVSLGMPYYYTIATTGIVERDNKKKMETSRRRSKPASATPLDTITLTLVGEAGEMATFEAEVQEGYIPLFKNIFVRQGERVSKDELDTGCTLLYVQQALREAERETVGTDVGPDGHVTLVHKKVKYIEKVTRAVLVNDKNEPLELWSGRRRKSQYEREARELFNKLMRLPKLALPKLDAKKAEKGPPMVVLTNKGDSFLTVVLRGRRIVKIDVPPGLPRAVSISPDTYAILAAYQDNEAGKAAVYHGEKVTLKGGTRYELKVSEPKDEFAPAGGGLDIGAND